ncbi:MAG: hypothetical protein Q8922_09010 [Bacteroidota bacterium]|nr:hypothetical protein [Bacteroidota bacterium]MDP4234297.1 hypothetical protein [Bacteroidota bacterium]MDP4288062.1 hypothetical protein [Bacteroidota bacterium]
MYSKSGEDEIIVFVEASIIIQEEWHPDEEISEIGFFAADDLPSPMNPRHAIRIADAFTVERGILRTF